MTAKKMYNDTEAMMEWLMKNFSKDELIIIITGLTEHLEDDGFTSALATYFQTYTEGVTDWFPEDD